MADVAHSQNAGNKHAFIPALGIGWLTPIFDPVVRLMMPEDRAKGALIDQADIQAGHQTLDIGCGTGTLLLRIKERIPSASVTGIDGDPQILTLARAKLDKAGVSARFDTAMSDNLPYPDGSFDRVVSSLMFHHLDRDVKRGTLAEAWRVLRPGGKIAILDLGTPHSLSARLSAPIARRLERAEDNISGAILGMMQEAGFSSAHEAWNLPLLFGTLTILVGDKTN